MATLPRLLNPAIALGRGLAATAIFCGALAACHSATAAPFFTVTSGSSFVTSLETFLWVGPRDPVTDTVQLWEGGTVGLSEPGYITLEYIGKEALFANNIFRWNNVDIFSTGPSSPLVTGQTAATPFPPASLATYVVPGVVSAGTLPFSFFISEVSKVVANDGSNLDIAVWPIPSPPTGSPINFGSSIYLLLDDENTVDTDHDDMIVRMNVTAVPEPGSLALVGMATLPLACWAGARWRRRGQQGREEASGTGPGPATESEQDRPLSAVS